MKSLCDKFARKLVTQRLSLPGSPIIGGLDAELEWNRQAPVCDELTKLFALMPINSLVFAKPAEPYALIIDFLATRHQETIFPEDTETRTFLHDIPICRDFSARALATALSKRKAVIIPGHGLISSGTVSPEQGFVFYSSTLFACFVLFFSEYLKAARQGTLDESFRDSFKTVVNLLRPPRTLAPDLFVERPNTEKNIFAAMTEAGRAVVDYGLVDSFFGNLSYRLGQTVYISQTGSSLDELEGCIDPCPMDGSTTHGLTASSELSAHEDIYRLSKTRCILHGHPPFSVIMSMDCDRLTCANKGQCHVLCTECRTMDGIPIVPGEVGTGPTGLCNTLPPAVLASGAAIVHGHGIFTTGAHDFNEAFATLLDIENRARARYFETLEKWDAIP
ncbi:class II aldolase/adducin family protein [Pseudodesulfovibrio piezophilus]|uniref:Class II aldolase/adducin family protein n=1 Tax=Pseudodesulfovibrio piezophilus (strain DSM 21447 / JCM 15486 / C1TLV30) TaxID=1322246 RepID=M1WSQ2_PSEP2|nr:class II aldolase/adducin family protein [Pseudodesulfovibrio piezophilus]CCH50324.1 Class II aldolase/adducin family protein [Pseudodesulfovibrio piezophilus C1TLV30]